MSVQIGDKAPEFRAKSAEGEEIGLGDYAGEKNVYLVFYPMDFSPVCSVQLSTYQRNLAGFQERDTAVIAINRDNAWSHKAFCESLGGIDFPVLSDMTLEVAKLYGVVLPQGINNRAEFLIDKEGVIRWMNIEKSPGDNTPTMEEIFGAIDAIN